MATHIPRKLVLKKLGLELDYHYSFLIYYFLSNSVFEREEWKEDYYLFGEVLWGYSIDPAYDMFNIVSDLLFKIERGHTTSASNNRGNGHSKGSSPRPRQQLIAEKHC